MGSARQSLTTDDPVAIPGTVWSPQLEDIPDITANIGREFSYGVLYNGYWDTPLTGTANDMEIIVPTAESDWDSTKASVERSWANRDPGLVLSDDVGPESGGKEEFYTDYEKEIYSPVTEEPSLNEVQNWDTSLNTKDASGTGPGPLTSDNVSIGSESVQRIALPLYTSKVWYTEQDTTKISQNSEFIQHYTSPMTQNTEITEDMQRALNILGYDILLRDEWTTSLIYNVESGGSNYYGYGYSNTNVLDSRELLGDNLLTSDYVLQSIYRALGVNCLRTETYFYADKDLTVDFTPLAEKITVAMDKINQIQNRVDVFVTRANLGDYWDKAVADGVVSNYGVEVLNTIDGVYKPYAVKCDKEYVDTQTNITYPKGTWIEMSGPISSGTTSASEITEHGARVDYNRIRTLTLAEFCVYVKKLMDIYGEEVMTEKEQEMLLVYYGTKLPYNLDSEEELEAIKYLMAKGIVSDSMYWNGDLTLRDMLVILSRVKDTGSRLTFKEIDLQYDESLVSLGYCPTNVSFVSDTSMGMVATTLNSAYSYKDAEWIDYFIRMPTELKAKDGTMINPRFMEKQGEQEITTQALCLDRKAPKDGENTSNEDTSGDHTYIHSNATYQDYDNINVIGYKSLNDGYEYLHFKVRTDVLYKDGKLNDDYVNTANNCIYINTANSEDKPVCWKISYYGGIYRNPKYSGGTVIWNAEKYYTKGKQYKRSSLVDLSSEKIDINDATALNEHKTCKSLVVSLNADGTVAKAYTFTTNGKTKDYSTEFLSFDNANWELKYCDIERYINGLAISLSDDPMLSDTVGDALRKMIPQYDIWFYVKSDESSDTDALTSSIYLGDKKIVDKKSPAEVLDTTGGIEFLGKSEGKYYYVARGQNTAEWLSNNLHAEGSSTLNATYSTGYIKQNNTLLIKDTDLFNIVESTNRMYKNGNITKISDDVVCISFDLRASTSSEAITHTIYMCESLKLIAVNNMLYEVPDDEILFVDNTASGGTYLLNYRAVVGWGSGYVFNALDNGDIEVKLSTIDDATGECVMDTDPFGILNAYTGHGTPTVVIDKNGSMFSIPASAPNNFASWLVYKSNRVGTYAIVLKNNDIGASNSVVKEIMNDDKLSKRYSEGAQWLNDIFGVSVGTSSIWYDSETLVSVYNLTDSDASPYVISYEQAMAAKKDLDKEISERSIVNAGGKFYYDEHLCTWAYIPVSLYTNQSYLSNTHPYNRFNLFIGAGSKTASDIKDSDEQIEKFVENYYKCVYPLPYVSIGGGSQFIDISCNVHSGRKYGSVPVWSVCTARNDNISTVKLNKNESNKKVFNDQDYNIAGDLWYPEYTSDTNGLKIDDKLSITEWSTITSLVPASPIQLIVGLKKKELSPDNFSSNVFLYWGNYPTTYHPSDNSITLYTELVTGGYADKPSDRTVYMVGLSVTKQIASLLGNGTAYEYTDNRSDVIKRTTRSALQELDQIGGVDWGAYTFDNLIHDIDNGMSILLIIVLNIIPRIGMFVFIILIGLSTVANMKPVRKFCDSVFDPYKLITLGHTTVYTINTKLLLISSIIGLAAFGLFMDGTIINLLTWLVQFVSAFVTR